MTDPPDHDADPGDHDADPRDHVGPILVITLPRSSRSRWADARNQTLNGSTMPFAKGIALDQWLGDVGALGQDGVPSTELSIYQSRFNASVGPANTVSQPWITADPSAGSGAFPTEYFSFDTPVGAPASQLCGRAVFSDLHVAGDPMTHDTMSPPGGCATGPLSPQEKALEFMLFDLSSCVIPDSQPPVTDGGLPPPPPK